MAAIIFKTMYYAYPLESAKRTTGVVTIFWV